MVKVEINLLTYIHNSLIGGLIDCLAIYITQYLLNRIDFVTNYIVGGFLSTLSL